MKRSKILCTILCAGLMCALATGCTPAGKTKTDNKTLYSYKSVDVLPTFDGASEDESLYKFQKWLYDMAIYNTSYKAYSRPYFGWADFVIEKDGSVSGVAVIPAERYSKWESRYYPQNDYADLLKVKQFIEMSEWTPAMVNGQPVDVFLSIKLPAGGARFNIDRQGMVKPENTDLD